VAFNFTIIDNQNQQIFDSQFLIPNFRFKILNL
jgi:hypothetical protein